MAYPDNIYPAAPAFPTGHEDVSLGPDLYTAISAYITALVTDMVQFDTDGGNIEIGADKGIKFDGTERIGLTGGEIEFTALQVNTEFVATTAEVDDLTCAGNIEVGNDITSVLTISVTGTISFDYFDRGVHVFGQIDEPGDPADNTAVFWVSSGVGYGDVGDFCCKITEGGGTTDFTIADYSAL